MDRVLCCALGVSWCLLAGCSHTAPIAKTRGNAVSAANPFPSRVDLAARIQAVEAEAERAKQAGDNTAALQAYRRLLLLDPGHVDAHHHLAVAADMEGEFSEAEQHYRAALARESENPDLRTSLGWSLFLQHRDGEATGELRRALELDPEHATALYNMGWLAAHRGEENEALQYFRRGGTEAQAQALLAKVRLELEDRSSRNESQRALARLGAPSPRGRLSQKVEPGGTTVQAGAEWEGAPSAAHTRTVSLEIEQPSLLESSDLSSPLDQEPESRLGTSLKADAEAGIRHLAERPPVATVARETEEFQQFPADGVTPEAAETELEAETSPQRQTATELGDSLSATQSHSRPQVAPPTRPLIRPLNAQEEGASAVIRPEVQSTTGSRPDRAAESADSGLPPDERSISPTDSWPAFSTRTLATVGRVMLGKPPREAVSHQAREATNADATVVREATPAVGERSSAPSRFEIDSELMHAARLGLNLGQPATRRFHVSNRADDESE